VPDDAQLATVTRIVDGDTIEVAADEPEGLSQEGQHNVRLLTYDAPEDTSTQECGGPEATAALEELIPMDATVYLEGDQEDTDQYDRFLRYVYADDGDFVNVEMVRQGHGEASLVQPNDAHIDAIRAAENDAKGASRGIWGPPCDIDAPPPEPEPQPEPQPEPEGNCHPSYPDVCIPPPPPDLDCGDITHTGINVQGSDPHRFDGDSDGVGCEG
jgi:micrococcal nuclease